MMKNGWFSRIAGFLRDAFSPPVHTLRQYSGSKFRRDLLAGLTVAVMEVPQAMAYALIAGVPPQYGIFTSIMQGTLGALLSSSEHMACGPTNTHSLLIASVVFALHPGTPAEYLQLVFALTLLKGIIQLVFAAARLGDLVRYVSRPVIVGLTAGAGVLIIAGQMAGFLGVKTVRSPSDWHGAIGALQRLIPAVDHANWRAILIGLGCMAVIIAAKKISRFIPGPLIAAVAAGVLVWACQWLTVVPVVGQLPPGFAHFAWPGLTLDRAAALLGGAFTLAVLGMIESVAIAKSIAAQSGARINANQEFFAQGFYNTATSFFQCIPGSGSFTRSALDFAAGAETRFAAVYNACFVAAIYLLFSDWARYIPLAALAAVLFTVAWSLMDFKTIRQILRTNRTDGLVLIGTFLATVTAPLEYAIIIGVVLNLVLFIRNTSRLRISQIVPTSDGFQESEPGLPVKNEDLLLLNVEGPLLFSIAGELDDYLMNLQRSGAKVVVLRMKRTQMVDVSIMAVLERFARDLKLRGGQLMLSGVRPELMGQLESYGLMKIIGDDNIFAANTQKLFAGTRQAISRGRMLLQSVAATPNLGTA